MSRAFTKEKGDWNFCRKKRDTCTYADENGRCIFSYCRRDEEEKAERDKAEQGKNT